MDYLSPEVYGIWLTVSSIMLWIGFFDVGFTLGLKNKLNEALAKNDIKKGKSLVSTTYIMMIIIFVPLALILELLIPFVNWSSFLNVSPIYSEQLTEVIRILVICVCLQMIFNTITSILAAYQRTAISNIFTVSANTLSVVVILILTKTVAPSIVVLSKTISFLPVLILFFSSIWLFRGSMKSVSPNVHYFNKKYIHDLFSLGLKFFLIQIQFVVLYQSTNILISNVSSPEDVTSYNVAYRYLSVGAMFFNIILAPLWPAFTDASAKQDFSWMKRIYNKMTKLYMLLLLGVIVMIILSPIAYKIWLGSTEIVSWSMTLSVGGYVIIHAWDSLQVTLINGIGAVKLQTYVVLIGLVLHIPLSLVLGKYVGGVGVIISMIIINLIYLIFFTTQCRRLVNNTATSIWCQ